MRVLILGGDGMLGHQLLQSLAPGHDVRVTLRQELASYQSFGLFHDGNAFGGVDVRRWEDLCAVIAGFAPDAIVNAVGIVKQRPSAHESLPSLEINALLPHRLALLCSAVGARLIHVSTDCVFSGAAGRYVEADPSDAADLYGRTKFLGEVGDSPALTLRTSIIGPELSRKSGLLEWFLAQQGRVKGFRGAVYSGFTTMELGRIIDRLLTHFPEAHGLYHVSSEPITKYDLLLLLRTHFQREVEIVPDDTLQCDRSLNSDRFRRAFDYAPPAWDTMCRELAAVMSNRVAA
jgi:dTDP-4-dehydrorhamnose reductase